MANFNILQPIQPPKSGVIANLPVVSGGGGGDDGIGGLLSGLKGLMGGLSQHMGGGSSTPTAPQPVQQSQPQVGSVNQGQVNTALQNPAGLNTNSRMQQLVQQNSNLPYMQLANKWVGTNEVTGHQALTGFFQKSLGQNIDPQTTPWCAAFVNGVLKQSNYPGTGSLAAKSFMQYGQPVNTPTMGDIVVLNRGNDPSLGHVGFFAGANKDGTINILGGNENNAVSVKAYNPGQVAGYRRPPSPQDIQTPQGQQFIQPSLKSSMSKAFTQPGQGAQYMASQQSQNPGALPTTLASNAHPDLQSTMNGIAYVETGRERGDPYANLGPKTKSGAYAVGKYQIMSSNVGPWTKEALGKAMSPDEFKNNPDAQEKTAAYMINQNLTKGYSPDDTASIWFSGRPMKKAGNAKDSFGTSVPTYVKVFNKGRELYHQQTPPGKPVSLNDDQGLIPGYMRMPQPHPTPQPAQPTAQQQQTMPFDPYGRYV